MKKKIVIFAAIFISCLSTCLLPKNKCTRFPPEGVSPLFSFGQFVLPKGSIAFDEAVIYFKFNKHPATVALTEGYYSLTDSVMLIGTLPIVSQKPPEGSTGKKTGLGDLYLHANWEIYNERKKDDYRFRLILTPGIKLPTSTVAQRTMYSFNTTSFFVGIVEDFLTNDWMGYFNLGALLPTKRHDIKFGNIFFNNIGLGKVDCYNNRLYLTYFAEMSMFYARPNHVNGILDLTTGETLVFVGPTFRLEYLTSPDPFRSIVLQLGIQFVVGHQAPVKQDNKLKYIFAGLLAYIF